MADARSTTIQTKNIHRFDRYNLEAISIKIDIFKTNKQTEITVGKRNQQLYYLR